MKNDRCDIWTVEALKEIFLSVALMSTPLHVLIATKLIYTFDVTVIYIYIRCYGNSHIHSMLR